MFSHHLQHEFRNAGFTPQDTLFIGEMCKRFPEVAEGFERAASFPTPLRAILTPFHLKQTARAGWRRIGVPENDIQTVADHSGTCAILSFKMFDNLHVSRIMTLHDVSESVVTDFTPHDPIQPHEKHQLEKLGMLFTLAGSPRKDESFALWMEFEEQKTPESHMAFDVDKLEMILQAQIYEQRYPHLKEKLGEFWTYVDTRLKTPEGRTFFDVLKKHHPEPHPLKLHLSRPHLQA